MYSSFQWLSLVSGTLFGFLTLSGSSDDHGIRLSGTSFPFWIISGSSSSRYFNIYITVVCYFCKIVFLGFLLFLAPGIYIIGAWFFLITVSCSFRLIKFKIKLHLYLVKKLRLRFSPILPLVHDPYLFRKQLNCPFQFGIGLQNIHKHFGKYLRRNLFQLFSCPLCIAHGYMITGL